MHALIEFAYAPKLMGNALTACEEFFGDGKLKIVVDYTHPFDTGGFSLVREMGTRLPSVGTLRRLKQALRRDLDGIAEAIEQPQAAAVRIMSLLRANKLAPPWDRAKLPEGIRERIDARLPKLRMNAILGLTPDEDASLESHLYYALALACARGVLERCGKCIQCKQLGVHATNRPSTKRFFCTSNCKTAFFNAQQSREQKTSAQRKTRHSAGMRSKKWRDAKR